jgi:hypothetical protein
VGLWRLHRNRTYTRIAAIRLGFIELHERWAVNLSDQLRGSEGSVFMSA